MRALALAVCAVLLVGCESRDEEPVPAAEAPAAAAPAPVSVADVAGTWSNTVTLEGVEAPVQSMMRGGADGNWTLSFPDRADDIPFRVHVEGDSLIGESAEYESVVRPGVMVTVRTASVVQGDEMVGNVLATYRAPEGDEQVRGTMRAVRAQ